MTTVIWNTTFSCRWDCVFCCVDADKNRQREMSFEQKLAVAGKLASVNCRVDVSGGEIMLNKQEHLQLLERLSSNLGRERVGVSCSGWGIDGGTAKRLAASVGDVEMTMDTHPDAAFAWRPAGYHKTAARAAMLLKQFGVRVGLQTVVTREHLNNRYLLDDLFIWLCKNGIDEWSILKFFPSGRGEDHARLVLSDFENRRIVEYIRKLDMLRQSSGKPKINFHYLMPGSEKSSECRCVRKSVGILPDGRVTACFWGLSKSKDLTNDRFYLGNVCTEGMDAILKGERSAYWRFRQGGCALGSAGTPPKAA
ncbi:MAG: SPASM domain-containing protein [Treponema sp.]|nr:SPASM domain-containing protein [Treponema sp.]